MLAEIGLGLQGINAAAKLIEALSGASTEAQINEVKIGLQKALLEAQGALFAAQTTQTADAARIGELEQEIVRLKDWEAQKQRYELKAVGAGRFAYALKPGMEKGEPPHSICERCYEDGHRSILQRFHNIAGRIDSLRCSRCGADVRLSH